MLENIKPFYQEVLFEEEHRTLGRL